jgi:hypothetical protein
VRGAGGAAVQALERDGAAAARDADAVLDCGDGADLRVLALVHRHEEHAVGVGDVDRQRDGHVREDDGVFEWNQQQGAQIGLLGLAMTAIVTSRVEVPSDS